METRRARAKKKKQPHAIITLTKAEHSTVLAALRYWEAGMEPRYNPDGVFAIATDGGAHKPMTREEVMRLCQRINTSPT